MTIGKPEGGVEGKASEEPAFEPRLKLQLGAKHILS